MNSFEIIQAGIDEAEARFRAADEAAFQLARMLRGRLRKVNSTFILKQLKRELASYNAHTGKWKEQE